MKLIKPKAELLMQESGVEGIYKQIELCGRTCYKSEDKIAEGAAKPFVDRMINSKHTAMLEQGTVYLEFYDSDFYKYNNPGSKYNNNKYSKTYYDHDYYCWFVTTNLRVLVENNWLDDLQYICDPTEFHEMRYTFKLTTDRGVSHELVRHRVMSFAQESTRYCNYSKGKFGGELTFIEPSWKDKKIAEYYKLIRACEDTEKQYLELIEWGATPQEARQILPNAIKTEICMTGFASDWKFFFDLRLFGKTGKPHPDMLQLAELMKDEAGKNGIWEDIMNQKSKFE